MPKLWKIKTKIPEELVVQYSNHDPLLAQLLHNRGLVDPEAITAFLNPEYEGLHSPLLFKDMQKAVERIERAIEKKEKITIYGDYDADAVTANAVLRQTFAALGHENIESYIPDRFSEGYGVNLESVARIKDQGSSVIITVDCGTNSTDVADFCLQNNIDFIITDHHEIIGELPKAYALINPKNPNDAYPDMNITGVGVAFKMACAILNKLKVKSLKLKVIEGWEKWLLDLVAIGTVADCHALLGENRIFVKYGLKVLQKTRWPGLKALVASSGLNFSERTPDSYTLGFVIAPRLNAAGRLEHADLALDLLLEKDSAIAGQKVLSLEAINRRRQDATARMLSEAREQALFLKDRKVLVLKSENWHKGVVGLVAGKIAEEFSRPAIVLAAEGPQITGSARSVGEFDIVAALKHSGHYLVRFGGHKQAAGLTLEDANFEPFYRSLLEYAEINLSADDLERSLELEAELMPESLTLKVFDNLKLLGPFGVGNPSPKFLLKNARIVSQKQVGADGRHLQMQIVTGEKTLPGIAFSFKPVSLDKSCDIACELLEDGWNGRKQLKLKIIDIRTYAPPLSNPAEPESKSGFGQFLR